MKILSIALLIFLSFPIAYQTGRKSQTTKRPTGRVEYSKFFSQSLKQDVDFAISLPASYSSEKDRRYPLIIFLHGLFNSERDWEERGMQQQLELLRAKGKIEEFIIALPYGENSFYVNGKDGVRYEDAIVNDFTNFVEKNYRTASGRKMIAGISMGGYGALMIAFKHPEKFTAVAANSAALFEEAPKPPSSPNDVRAKYRYEIASKIFGSPIDQEFFKSNNPLHLAKANAAKLKGLKIYFDVGEQDRYGFEAGNNKLASILTEAGIAYEYHKVPGGHGWDFLISRSEPFLNFCWKAVN
ncbi:MAG: hypothetical protein JNN15_16745 [Blastocatellia bacterium]|nr:hypothetical protein [Blastocatellia bacterium]